MLRALLVCSAVVTLALVTVCFAAAQPAVHVQPVNLEGPRALEDQTREGAVRDYLESWQSLRAALGQNRADLLDRDFTGSAKERIDAAIRQQAAAGIHANYRDKSHDLKFVFYSPDGLSIELTDNAEYEVQLFDGDKPLASTPVRARYIVVLTPAEVRWKVRVFQATPEEFERSN